MTKIYFSLFSLQIEDWQSLLRVWTAI